MAGPPRLSYVACVALLAGVLITYFNVWQLRVMQQQCCQPCRLHGEFDLQPESGYLEHVYAVLNRLGWRRERDVGTHEQPQAPPQWDLLWHHDYPFLDERVRPIIADLLPHQLLNHIPGSGYYTSKVNLATSNITGIPVAFGLPERKEAFQQYARANGDRLWVQKSNRHRGIMILSLDKLDLSAENSFVQEYVAKPLLIDGRKFDIGIYTVVTSALPLRVYTFDQDALLRFCPEEYHPFDAENLDKYVVGDDYKPTWTMPSLQKYFVDMRMTYKESLNAYLRSIGKDPAAMWAKMADTIRQVFLTKAPEIQALVENYKQPWNFFELSRFDFVVDEFMNVYLMEANMSPNLSSGHFAQNKALYERVIYNMLGLVGVGRHLHSDSLKMRSGDEEEMLASDGDIMPEGELCDQAKCAACVPSQHVCSLCRKCMAGGWRESLRRAYLEHVNRGGFRRVLPEPLPDANAQRAAGADPEQLMAASVNTYQWRLSDVDKQMRWWFWAMCRRDHTWCS